MPPAPLLFRLDLDTFIKALSEHIGTDWKALARALGLSRTDIAAIEYENRFSLKDQIYEFFYKWKQQEGKNASIQKLVSGLKAEKLEEPLRKMGEAGLLPKDSQRQYLREQRLKHLLSDKSDSSPLLPGSPRDTQRTCSVTSTDSVASGEQECLQMDGGDPPCTTGGNKLQFDRPFEVGDVVKVEQKQSPWYGVIRWIGQLPRSSKSIAGIEMEDQVLGGCSGEFQGVKYFDCAPDHGLFFPVNLLKRDDRFEGGDVETDETRRLSGSLSKSAEMQPVNTPRQQPQTDTDQRRALRSESLTPTSQGYSPAGKVETSQSAGSTPPGNSSSFTMLGLSSDQSTYDALKELETMQPPSNPGQPEASTSAEGSSDKPFKGLVFFIPGDRTGMVIGRDGKNIRQVESETNTIIKVDQPSYARLSQNAQVIIVGSEQNCKKALCIILENLRKKISQQLATTETMTIPGQIAGRVIGKGGSTLSAIEKLTGARVNIEKREGLEALLDDSRICKITGMAEEIKEGKELIQEAMQGVDIAQRATFVAIMVTLMKKFKEMGFVFPDVDEK